MIDSRTLRGVALVALAVCACVRPHANAPPAARALETESPAAVVVSDAPPFRAEVREILVQPCGSCHLSSRSTAVAGALAVFNLDEEAWDVHLTDEQVRGLGERVESTESVDRWEKDVVGLYLRCRLEKVCGPSESR